MNSLAIKKENFNEERFIETAKKFSDVSQHHTFENFIIMHKTAIKVLGDYIGIRPINNNDFISMMQIDKDLQSVFVGMSASLRTNLPAKRFLALSIGDITLSIIQGYYAYTKKEDEYEIAILNKKGMISCCEFKRLNLPEGINTGDYSICETDCQEEYCSSQVIGYLQFDELIDYICAIADRYLKDKWKDIVF